MDLEILHAYWQGSVSQILLHFVTIPFFFFFFTVMDFECLLGQDKEQAAMKMHPWTQLP